MAAIGFTQVGRALRIDTPLGPDALLLRRMNAQESVSQLFLYQLDLLSEDDAISFDGIVGKKVSIHLQTVDSERGFSGYISRFSQGGRDERFTYYHAEMRPWLWFLTRKADCRIFQRKTVPDILKKLFDELKFPDFELRLYNSYRPRDYCVQYRETDFNFVSRLMEEEGISYFFEHTADGSKHTLVLADDPAANKPCPGQPKARCDFATGGRRNEDLISDWRAEQEYRPKAWTHTDYNFETPSTSLMATVKDDDQYEIYDYPGIYLKKGEGDQIAKTRLQETVALKNRVTGKSNCRCFTAGSTVEVTDHYRKDMNRKWMLTAVYQQLTMGEAYGSGGTDEGFVHMNTFECIPASVPFRPQRLTPKPAVQGCQTAVVVGPSGEEIYTDKFGRVKVQFHWDREGKKNEDSSCWIRVSHPWAGKGWGGIHIPRIGQEVIVGFLEGDPDQPIIVGRVYHAENMPPWGLPAQKVISGIKSDSTKGGGGYNEISMNDTKGTELINIHGQFDMNTTILHDEKEVVKNNKNVHVLKELRTQVDQKVSHTASSDIAEHFKANHAEVVDAERYLKANRIIIEAGTEICIKVGGNSVQISAAGVYVDGTMVDINCGHPALNTTLGGLTPTTPEDPS
jgi:type VI secretion system secreted protein VgrG